MSKTATKDKVFTDGVKVDHTVVTAKPIKSVVVQRKVSSETVANELTSRITAKLIGFDDLYDPKTQQFLTEDELRAKGAVFVTVSLNKVLVNGKDLVVKSRITKEPTPFIRKTSKYQVIANINWQSYINKRGHGSFVPDDKPSNGIENYENCKAIGTLNGFYYVKGVAFRVLEATKYFDENGNEYPDKIALEKEYVNKTSKASKQKEADKHGIDVRFDPQFRSTRIDNCDSVKCFGFEFKPTDNINNR